MKARDRETVDLHHQEAAAGAGGLLGPPAPADAVQHRLEQRVGLVEAQPADDRRGHRRHHHRGEEGVAVARHHQAGVDVGGELEDQGVEQERRQAEGDRVERQGEEQEQRPQQDHQDGELHRDHERHHPPVGFRRVDGQAREQAGGQQQGQQVDQPDQGVATEDAPEPRHTSSRSSRQRWATGALHRAPSAGAGPAPPSRRRYRRCGPGR